MLKKNDKVVYRDSGIEMRGTVKSCIYNFVTENNKYVDVYFNNTGECLPLPIKLLEKI